MLKCQQCQNLTDNIYGFFFTFSTTGHPMLLWSIVVDSLTFFVDGTANNKVGHYFVAEIQFMHWTSSCYKRGWGGINIYMYNPENTSIQTDVWFVYMWFSTFMLTIVQSIIWYKKAVLGSILVLWHWALFFLRLVRK